VNGYQSRAALLRRPVVAGVDGSTGSRSALLFAVEEAVRRGVELDVVIAYSHAMPWAGAGTILLPEPEETWAADAESTARALVDDVLREAAGRPGIDALTIRIAAVAGPAPRALADWSRGAGLLVVGSRGRGAFRSAVLGSVALHCVAGAHCPVVVVVPDQHATVGGPVVVGPVVVGIDGSDASRAALRAGIDEAARRGTAVEAVAAFYLGTFWYDANPVVLPNADEVAGDLRKRVEALVGEVAGEAALAGGTTPPLRITLTEGRAVDVLTEAAKRASLLVLGSRGRSAVRGLLLGSVAFGAAISATCPVMVVHPLAERADAAAAAEAALARA
jgi:nucleotide-binding universal stress UspA family protein